MRANTSAIILIVLGGLFLARNLDLFDINIGRLVATWWPLILIAVGVSMLVKDKDTPKQG